MPTQCKSTVFCGLALSAAVAGSARGGEPPIRPASDGPNIVIFMTDDQRWDTITPEIMPLLNQRLIEQGILFINAFVNNPICCPIRATLLSGGFYSHETQVLSNQIQGGAARSFNDARALPVIAQRQGYYTGFVGKYMNEFQFVTGVDVHGEPIEPRHYVPPGWDLFAVEHKFKDWFGFEFWIGRSTDAGPASGLYLPDERDELEPFLRQAGIDAHVSHFFETLDYENLPYITRFDAAVASSFIRDAAVQERPFFLLVATRAPHGPATPEPQYEDLFTDFEYRGRSWGEADLSDKPAYVGLRAAEFDACHAAPPCAEDEFARNQLRCLRTVDDLIGEIVDLVESDEHLRDNTWFLFLSDNGYLWGEHRLFRKKLPYEESVRVPLVMRTPARQPAVNEGIVAAGMDVAATVLSLMGVEGYGEGRPLSAEADRKRMMCESFRVFEDVPTWASWRTRKWKYIHHDTGEAELYRLARDSFELDNVVEQFPRRADRFLNKLKGRRALTVMGPERDVLWHLPPMRRGIHVERPMTAIGGKPPYEWTIVDDERYIRDDPDEYVDRIPDGLELSPDGVLFGAPTETGLFEFFVEVADRSETKQHGGPQRLASLVRVEVQP